MNKYYRNAITLIISIIVAFVLMRAFLGEILSRVVPYASEVFFYSMYICLFLTFHTILNVVLHYIKYKKIYISKFGFSIFVISYFIFVVSILFSRNSLGNFYKNNFIPLKTIFWFLTSKTDIIYKISNLLGNIVIFIPFGAILYFCLHKRVKYIYVFFICFLLVTSLEFFQTKYAVGSFDIDDIILNSMGVTLGILSVFKKKIPN
jgi:glycopeptide antibiotics resistance protein